ncbi:flagellar hook-length control protein FliK [Pseudomonas sp. ABC1]|nr:flagellar hook-length control protein FliK [Pseudomonas sp. ABC1]QLF94454.1 flagellar hook-length control protein FliK [Pseudomonas sp. ABC1]
MAVSPDLLLNTRTTETRSSERSQSTEKSAGQDSARFSQVYAQERQARSSAPRERSAPETNRPREAAANDGKQPAVAESGKDLPVEEVKLAGPEDSIDPLAFLGLPVANQVAFDETVELPSVGLSVEQPDVTDVEPELQVSQALLGEQAPAPETAQPLSVEPELDLTPEVPVIAMAAQAQQVQVQVNDEPEVEAEQDELPELLSSVFEEAPSDSDNDLLASQRVEESSASQEAQERPVLNTPYAAVQAAAARAVVVPGQPVAIQQAGSIDAVVDRVMWLSSQNLKSAEIQLDPAELGRLEVRIDMNKDQAQVTFMSPHAVVRDALEGQMPRLRDMFSQQGMNLLEANVSDQSQARDQQQAGTGRGSLATSSAEDEQILGVSEISADRAGGGRGLVDYYA